MSSVADNEWAVISPTTSRQTNMDSKLPEAANQECTINTKSTVDSIEDKTECTCDTKPKLVRKDSIDSIDEDYRRPRRTARVTPAPRYRGYTSSPEPYCPPPPVMPISVPYPNRVLTSSTQLLEQVGKEDGIVDFPGVSARNVYLTTYPFGSKDVKKWAWLFAAGVEDEYVTLNAQVTDVSDVDNVDRVRLHRNEPIHNLTNIDIPCVYLSRALDTEVVLENSKHRVRYLIVVRNRHQPNGSKLLVAESNKAAGVLMFHEILRGSSVLFVGATVHQCKTVHSTKYRKVESLEEAISLQDEGFVGVVC